MNTKYSVDRRRILKARLVAHHGGICVDCKNKFPPYIMHFDHRDPDEKSFTISSGGTYAYERLLEESLKCDLVCGNCHAERTHLQRCPGCEYCVADWDGIPYGGYGREPRKTCVCGKKIDRKNNSCRKCQPSKFKIEWPPLDELLQMVAETNYCQVARQLGVTDGSVRKHIARAQAKLV